MTRTFKYGLNPNQYFGLNYLFSLLFSLVLLSRFNDFASVEGGHAILCSNIIGSGLITASCWNIGLPSLKRTRFAEEAALDLITRKSAPTK